LWYSLYRAGNRIENDRKDRSMELIKETDNEHNWPRKRFKAVPCGQRDLVIKVADWTGDPGHPAFDVECYIGGVYDWNESKSFSFSSPVTKEKAKKAAIAFARKQIAKLL